MHTAKFLILLAVYASSVCSRSTLPPFTWHWITAQKDMPKEDRSRIEYAMNTAVESYNARCPNITGQDIGVVWEKNLNHIYGSRKFSTIHFPADKGSQVYQWAISQMSKVMGVGTTDIWTERCRFHKVDYMPHTLNLFHYYNGDKAVLNCDNLNFWPYGLNDAGEFTDANVARHQALVQQMVIDGLQTGNSTS